MKPFCLAAVLISTALVGPPAHAAGQVDFLNSGKVLPGEWAAFNEVYRTYFSGDFPARSAFGADGLAFNARVEVTCIGAVGIERP